MRCSADKNYYTDNTRYGVFRHTQHDVGNLKFKYLAKRFFFIEIVCIMIIGKNGNFLIFAPK